MTHEIIRANEAPSGVSLTIKWHEAGTTTSQFYCFEAAKALGWQRPDPPAPPAWMVEVARDALRDERGLTAREIAIRVLRLALERGHVLDPAAAEPRSVRSGGMYNQWVHDIATCVAKQAQSFHGAACHAIELAAADGHIRVPRALTEEDLLKGAREDAIQAAGGDDSIWEMAVRRGEYDGRDAVQSALRARRNILSEIRAVAAPAVPNVDLKAALEKAWGDGFDTAGIALEKLSSGAGNATTLYANEREMDVSAILEDLPTREA